MKDNIGPLLEDLSSVQARPIAIACAEIGLGFLLVGGSELIELAALMLAATMAMGARDLLSQLVASPVRLRQAWITVPVIFALLMNGLALTTEASLMSPLILSVAIGQGLVCDALSRGPAASYVLYPRTALEGSLNVLLGMSAVPLRHLWLIGLFIVLYAVMRALALERRLAWAYARPIVRSIEARMSRDLFQRPRGRI